MEIESFVENALVLIFAVIIFSCSVLVFLFALVYSLLQYILQWEMLYIRICKTNCTILSRGRAHHFFLVCISKCIFYL